MFTPRRIPIGFLQQAIVKPDLVFKQGAVVSRNQTAKGNFFACTLETRSYVTPLAASDSSGRGTVPFEKGCIAPFIERYK